MKKLLLFCALSVLAFTANAQSKSASAQMQDYAKNYEFSLFINNDQQQKAVSYWEQWGREWLEKKRKEEAKIYSEGYKGKYFNYFIFSDFMYPQIKTKKDYEDLKKAYEEARAKATVIGKIVLSDRAFPDSSRKHLPNVLGPTSLEIHAKPTSQELRYIYHPGYEYFTSYSSSFIKIDAERRIRKNKTTFTFLIGEDNVEINVIFGNSTRKADCIILKNGSEVHNSAQKGYPWDTLAGTREMVLKCAQNYEDYFHGKNYLAFRDALDYITKTNILSLTHKDPKIDKMFKDTANACLGYETYQGSVRGDKNNCKNALAAALDTIGEDINWPNIYWHMY